MLAYTKYTIYICNIIIKTTITMKVKIKFKSCSSDKIYQTVIEIEEYTLSKIIKDEHICKIFKTEKAIENKTHDILILTGIEDIDHT